MAGQDSAINGSEGWLRMSLSLAFVIGLVFLCAWLLKRIASGRHIDNHSLFGSINILAKTHLGEKRFLMVVGLEERFFFLGITGQNITLIAELSHFQAQTAANDTLFEKLFKSAHKHTEKGDKK